MKKFKINFLLIRLRLDFCILISETSIQILPHSSGYVGCECVQDGFTTRFRVKDRMWCCKTTEDQCVFDQFGTNIICNGKALNLSNQCHNVKYDGPSCNYWPGDQARNGGSPEDGVGSNKMYPRSHLDLCQDNRYHYKAGFAKKFDITFI